MNFFFYLFSKNVKHVTGVDECANMKCIRIRDIAFANENSSLNGRFYLHALFLSA